MNRRSFLHLLGAACGGALAPAAAPARHPLMTYPDDSGAWLSVKTTADWAHRRDAILHAMQTIMGPLPGAEKRCPLDIQIREEVATGTLLRRAISYASEPGSRVPAYLLIPKHHLARDKAYAFLTAVLRPAMRG